MLSKEQKQRLIALHGYEWVDEEDDQSTAERLHTILSRIDSIEELWYAASVVEWAPEDGDLDFFRNHPLCDRGLALRLYWGFQPDHYYRQKDKGKALGKEERARFTVMKEIEADLLAGRYPRELIAFDPKDVVGREITDEDRSRPGLRHIPKELRIPTTGAMYALDYTVAVFGPNGGA